MLKQKYIYRFTEDAPIEEVGDILCLAALATESLHGRSSLRLDGTFLLEKEKRQCLVNAATQVGRDLARIFTGYLAEQIGEKAFKVRLADSPECAPLEGGVQ
jgi:hypothetical protein